ncbi:MAG: hypothetical protein SFU53_14715 [Terrimicrobiaceae bacterium]|nr:hypothetical protein [Terrimicrobiaceae bacterium]
MRRFVVLSLAASASVLLAQDAGDVGNSAAATGGARPPQMNEGFVGRDIPAFDPGSEVVAYDGKIWNINNNRLFRARFEKFLNAPPATSDEDRRYRETVAQILELLTPGNTTRDKQEQALKLLRQASDYPDDANLCITLADAVYAARTTLGQIDRIKRENELLEKERQRLEWNAGVAARNPLTGPTPRKDDPLAQENAKIERDARLASGNRQLNEVSQTIENNKLRIATLEMNAKGHMQALILQFFATRRFQHVLIGNRLYRTIFTDSDGSLDMFKRMADALPANRDAGQIKMGATLDPQVSGEAKGGTVVGGGASTDGGAGGGTYFVPQGQSFSARGIKADIQNVGVESLVGGMATAAQAVSKLINSLSQLEGLANEAIRDVNEGVEAYKFLLAQNELRSATERLAETFAIGEFLPSVRLLTRDDKRRALQFTQLNNELLAALEVNDLTRAEALAKEIQAIASDFDASKPLAKIETARMVSSLHLAKARNAAAAGDRETMEAELKAATAIWPRNPALAELAGSIFSQSDVQQKAIVDFEQLLGQKNYRRIAEDQLRFIAATAMYPDKQEQLRKVLEQITGIEAAIIRAQEIEKRGDAAGAWESVERAFQQFPDDNKLNQVRADLTTKAADFVRALRQAEDLEKRDQPGSALAWFLKAQRAYPASDFAREGIERVTVEILPDAK